MNLQEIFPQRLKNARIRRGYSNRSLAEAMKNIVSAETLRNYENGKSFPNSDIMERLLAVLDVKIDDLFRPFTIDWSKVNFSFRKRKSVTKAQEEIIMQQIKDDAEHYIELEETLNIAPTIKSLIDYCHRNVVLNEADARITAQSMRMYLNLSEEPIVSIQDVVERCGVKLLPVAIEAKMDGVNFECNGHVFICYNSGGENIERRRFTIAHELGHLLLNIPSQHIEKEEKLCDAFASELILPSVKLKQMLGENRHNISLRELKQIQSLFGMSVDAIMYSAKEHNIITENRLRTYFVIKRTREKLAAEIDKSVFQEDDKNRYESLVYRALSSEMISVSKAAYFLNTTVENVSSNLKLVWRMKEIVIYDANIFIDVIDMEIIKALREADYRIYTTSLVTNEIIRTEQKAALSGLQISIYRYDSIEQYADLYAFKDSIHPKKNLSDSDFSVLKLAIDMSVPLYTSDAKLRSVARINGVEVHGSLGLVIELNKAGLLSCEEAKEAILRLQKTNTRITEKVFEEALDALKWAESQMMLSEKIDCTAFLTYFIENYPQSVEETKKLIKSFGISLGEMLLFR